MDPDKGANDIGKINQNNNQHPHEKKVVDLFGPDKIRNTQLFKKSILILFGQLRPDFSYYISEKCRQIISIR